MNRIFISYSGRRVKRSFLFSAFRDHGLNPWRDVESLALGDDTTETIEAELAMCSGVLLWINEEVLSSDYVANVELPAVVRQWSTRRLRIVPVFDGLAPDEATERLSKFGFEFGDSNGFVVDRGLREENTAAEIASRYVYAHVQDEHRRGMRPVVRLVTYDDTAALREEAVLNFDWRHHLQAGTVEGPSEQCLRSALAASSAALKGAYGTSEIELAVKAHLPLAAALGHAFAEPTGCTLRMTRDDSVFVTDRARGDYESLEEQDRPKGPIASRAAAIEVSVSRNVEAGVNEYVGKGHRYRHRTRLVPRGDAHRTSLDGNSVANVWARQVADAIVTLADRNNVDRVDLFLATPVELAVMIGWWTNASGRIDLMNWAGKTGPYERLWTLP